MGSKFPLLILCDEILVFIASYLSFKDRTNLRLVCQKLRNITDSSSLWTKKIYINIRTKKDCKPLAQLLLCRNVKTICLHRTTYYGVHFLRELSTLLCSTLKGLELSFHHYGANEEFEAFSECKYLETLDIDTCGNFEENQICQMNSVLKNFVHLKDIKISNVCGTSKSSGQVLEVLSEIPHLRHINMENWYVSILDLHALLCTHTQLHTLHLNNVEMIHTLPMSQTPDLRSLKELHISREVIHMRRYMKLLGLGSQTLPSLRLLSLAGSIDKLPVGFWSTFPNLRHLQLRHNCLHDDDLINTHKFNLQSLTLRNSISVSEKGLLSIASTSGDTLHTLVLHNCSRVRFERVKFWSSLTVLQNLNLTGCIQLSEHGLQHIVTNVSSLNTLNITGCVLISQRCLSYLKHKHRHLKWIV